MQTDRVFEVARRATLAVALIVCAIQVPLAAAAEPDTAPALAATQEAIDAVLAVLREDGLTADERRARIEKIAYDRFDFSTMSKLVLGRNRSRFSAEDQQRFADLFRSYLSNQYGHRVESYEQESIEVLGARAESRGDVTVFTKVVGGEYDGATIDYRMRDTGGTWRVIDVIIEQVSLVSNYRDQFGEVIEREGPAGLLGQLEEKNAKGVADESPPPAAPGS